MMHGLYCILHVKLENTVLENLELLGGGRAIMDSNSKTGKG